MKQTKNVNKYLSYCILISMTHFRFHCSILLCFVERRTFRPWNRVFLVFTKQQITQIHWYRCTQYFITLHSFAYILFWTSFLYHSLESKFWREEDIVGSWNTALFNNHFVVHLHESSSIAFTYYHHFCRKTCIMINIRYIFFPYLKTFHYRLKCMWYEILSRLNDQISCISSPFGRPLWTRQWWRRRIQNSRRTGCPRQKGWPRT